MRGAFFSSSTLPISAERRLALTSYEAALHMQRRDGAPERLTREEVDVVSEALAEACGTHRWAVRHAVGLIGVRGRVAQLAVFGKTLAEVEEIAANMSEMPWGLDFTADIGTIARGESERVGALVGRKISKLFGSAFAGSRDAGHLNVLYLELHGCHRVHRFHLGQPVMCWNDYGRVIESDFEEGDVHVDLAELHGLRGAEIVGATMNIDRLVLTHSNGSVAFGPDADGIAHIRVE